MRKRVADQLRYLVFEPRHEKPFFVYAKTKAQTSCAVTAQLISAFVFATKIVQSLFFLNLKFLASSHLLWVCGPGCVGPCWKPRSQIVSCRGSFLCLDSGKLQNSKTSLIFNECTCACWSDLVENPDDRCSLDEAHKYESETG